LIYLRGFSISAVKIDGSSVRDTPHDPGDAAIVSAVISLCRSLKLGVVAEGVETEEQLAFLRSHDCELVQGYLLGRPVPADRISALLPAIGVSVPARSCSCPVTSIPLPPGRAVSRASQPSWPSRRSHRDPSATPTPPWAVAATGAAA
jgi:hypothetical protein